MNSRSYRVLTGGFIYLTVIAAVLTIATFRSKAVVRTSPEADLLAAPSAAASAKPYFSLSTNRTYGSGERARLWIDYHGVDKLDFRVYRVKDPLKFFTQLDDPHQMGEREEEEFAGSVSQKPSALERLHQVKRWVAAGVKSYVRTQLQHTSRKSFNQKFRTDEVSVRTPLNVADYARVPLLNRDQLVSSWREPLSPLQDQYDRRMVPLDKREPGVYLIEAVGGELRAYTVVVVTDLTMVDKTTGNGELLIYTVDRKTGEPRPNAQIQVIKDKKAIAGGATDGQGILRTSIDQKLLNSPETDVDPATDATRSKSFLILANQGENFAISDLQSYYFGGYQGEDEDRVKSYIYTDRPVYRPSHKVYFKGILRAVDERGNYQRLNEKTVNVTIEDPNNARVFARELPLSARGTFSGEMEVSAEAALGGYQIVAETDVGSSSGRFEVAEYKKPEYKVKVSAPKKYINAGEKMQFSVNARYFFGSPVANADVKYYIYRSRYYGWNFGEETDETGEETEGDDDYTQTYGYGNDMVQESEGKLNAQGQLSVEFQIPGADENDPWDYSYRLDAQVTDSSRRTLDGAASFVATRGKIVAYASPDRYVYTKGDVAKIRVTTTDYEGRPVAAKTQLRFIEHTWTRVEKKSEDGFSYPSYEMHEREVGSAALETDSQGEGSYNYTTSEAGNLSIKVIVHDGGKQIVSVGGNLWVTDRQQIWSDSAYYDADHRSIKLVPDKKSYRPGETARVLAILPTANAHLLVSTELSTVLSARLVNAPGRSIILDVPIEASYAPNVFLSVTYVNDGELYTSDQRLIVPARDKMLNLEIIANKQEYKPRETASYTILARGADGAPVSGAEVSLGVVDEAIYSVSPDYSGNINREFYGLRYKSVETHLSISYGFTGYAGERPLELARNKPAYELADFKNEGDVVEPVIRKNFKDTAFWQPDVITGSDGRASVKVRLPDNLTTWRATARGVTSDTKVGATNYKVVSRKDVIVRLETPRFVTQGDTVRLSGIVHNYLNRDMATQISISVEGAQLLSPSKQTVTISKQGEHRVDWQISAPNIGQMKLLAKALTNTESDAVELPLEVVPRGLHQVKNETWTSADDNADRTFALDLPANADARARKLRIEVSPSIAGTLFGALDYLTTYPYGCTEQTMSSFLPNVVVSQALHEVKSTSIRSSNDLEKKVSRGLDRLYAFQHGDGGWGWWKDDQSDPFMTAYVIDGLTLAKQGGYQIDDSRVQRGRQKLQEMLSAGKTEEGTTIDAETRAFMVYALGETGGVEGSHIDRLFAERSNLQPYGRALLALALDQRKDKKRAAEVVAEIERAASDDGVSVHWQSKRKEMLDFVEQNDTEATALSLKALARIKPESPLMPRAARWLVSQRPNSYYWNSTKDTAFAIFGLIDYLKVSRELSPNYDFEVYLNGETVLAEHVTSTATSQTFVINRKASEISPTNHIRVVKRGHGTLYFSTAIDYYTGEEDVAARGSTDLNLTREYLRLRVVEDGYKLKWALEPLTGEIHSGDLLVVRLRINGAKARHLMIEDPIPAGAEQVGNVGNLNLDYTSGNGWTNWYSSREFRDQRTVFFLDYFDGDATFQYAMRVQVPGEFRIAPARAELMYQPATQTNTTSGRMTFLERK
ncbi:MAG: MG2 domain-containing protein [Pyrinomonadaceae bacterium]|nr:MG2 domain-containing protein [Pyrinomonadaceae bacterium]